MRDRRVKERHVIVASVRIKPVKLSLQRDRDVLHLSRFNGNTEAPEIALVSLITLYMIGLATQ